MQRLTCSHVVQDDQFVIVIQPIQRLQVIQVQEIVTKVKDVSFQAVVRQTSPQISIIIVQPEPRSANTT